MAIKESCYNVTDTINKVMPMVQYAVNMASLINLGNSEVIEFQNVLSSLGDLNTDFNNNRHFYDPVGKFSLHF